MEKEKRREKEEKKGMDGEMLDREMALSLQVQIPWSLLGRPKGRMR